LGMEGFAWGVLIGAFLGNFCVQLIGARSAGMVFRLNGNFKHPEFKRYILLTLPLMLGLTMTFSTEFFIKFFGSYLPRGSIASLNYALRVMLVLVAFFGQAVGTASFPYLARLAAEKKVREMNALLNSTLMVLALVLPFSVLFIVLRHELIVMLFQRGRFDAAATALTGQVMVFLMAGAFAFAAQTVVVRGFYAVKNTLLPAVFGTLAVGLSVPVFVLGMQIFGIGGVALAISFSAVLQVLVLFSLWNRKSGNTQAPAVYRAYLKMALFSAPLGLVLYGIRRLAAGGIDVSTFLGSLSVTMLTAAAFMVLMAAGGTVLKIQPLKTGLDQMAQRIRERIGR